MYFHVLLENDNGMTSFSLRSLRLAYLIGNACGDVKGPLIEDFGNVTETSRCQCTISTIVITNAYLLPYRYSDTC